MSNSPSQETVTIPIARIGERFAPLRIVEPQAERSMLHSMEKYGQLTPVAVCRVAPGEQELLDGFKRLRAARQLGLAELSARPFDLTIRAGKATMLQLNRVGRAISGMEEALVVHSLCHEDGLNQVEIALLLNRHKSWVCRRLALIERLSDEAQQMIRLGLLPASLGTELSRLQRHNQDLLLVAIREQHLSVREARTVVNALANEPHHNHEAILRDPRGSLLSPDGACPAPTEEKGLSYEAKKVLRRLFALERTAWRWRFWCPVPIPSRSRPMRKCACGPPAAGCFRASPRRHGTTRDGDLWKDGGPMTVFIKGRAELEQELVILNTQKGWSIRVLARHFGISRNMVRRILRRHERFRDEGHDILKPAGDGTPRPSKLDPFDKTLTHLLEKFPRISGVRLMEELRATGYAGGISILRDRLRKRRTSPKKEPVIRFETDPGVQGQMDWSPYTIKFLRTGKQQVQCFSYILGFSRRQFIDFTPRRDFFTLIRRHQDAFSHFQGAPAQCLYDSEKTVVLRWEAGRPLINPAFSSFVTHYRNRPIICQRGRPQTKGKIERPFQYVEGNLLCGREFQDLEDLKNCARWWLAEKSDLHLHDTTGRPPLELFLEQELAALTPLPLHPYDCAEVALRVCDLEGYLGFETNRYPVPYEHVADILTMKVTEHEVLIYSPELALVVRHERVPDGSRITLDGSAIHGVKTLRYGLEPMREQFLQLGDHTEEFLRGLVIKNSKNPGFHARYILHLKERYTCGDIDLALGHASRYHAYDCKAVERILAAKAIPRTLESVRNEKAAKQLRAALPKIKQRPLNDYAALLTPSNRTEADPYEDNRQCEQNQELPENTET